MTIETVQDTCFSSRHTGSGIQDREAEDMDAERKEKLGAGAAFEEKLEEFNFFVALWFFRFAYNLL